MRRYNVNANQVSLAQPIARQASRPPPSSTPGLVPVTITPEPEDEAALLPAPTASEPIEIDVAGNYRVRVGNELCCAYAEASSRRFETAMSPVPSGMRVWLAVGRTDMRRGMNGLALQVQETLGRDPFVGDVFVFRGARGDLIKILWHDGLGLSLYAKRLERGRLVWPSANGGQCRDFGRAA